MKKAISAATSAALVASLLATVVAPVASAAVATGITSLGGVAVGVASGPVTVSLHEQTVNSLQTTGTLEVILTNGTWSGTPVFSVAAGSLQATTSINGSTLYINIGGFDNSNTEDIVVTGLKVTATAAGAVTASLTDTQATGHTLAGAFIPSTTTATGILQAPLGTPDSTVSVLMTSTCGFDSTNFYSTATFSDTTDARNVVTATAGTVTVNPQNVEFAVGANTHPANTTTVSQTVVNCSLTYPYLLGTIATGTAAVAMSTDAALPVFPGEADANASPLRFIEPAAGYLLDTPATTLTFKITTPGVTFSHLPTAAVWCANSNLQFVGQTTTACAAVGANSLGIPAATWAQFAPPVMSADHTTVSLTVAAHSTIDSTTGTDFALYDIHYDVPASVTGGTFIGVNATINNGLFISPTSVNNAVVFRGISATATPTTVLIGQNYQKSGALSFTESTPGFFSAASSMQSNSTTYNMFGVCLTNPDSFDAGNPPYAKVTPGTGVLVLRDGAAPSTTGIVAGTPIWNPFTGVYCYQWTVWTASTVASTITIGYKDFSSGAWIDENPNGVPGPVNMTLSVGNDAIDFSVPAAVVTVANRIYANQVAVTALSQPTLALGTVGLAGNLQIAETGIGQLKLGEDICVQVMPRATTGHDVSLGEIHTATTPLATVSGGLIIDRVSMWEGQNCDGSSQASPNTIYAFHFHVLQQSTTGTGKIVISSINYIVPADAPTGNVLVNVYGYGVWPTEVNFQSQVSNAKLGTAPAVKFTVGTAVGATKNATFTTKTKVVKLAKYVTWRFSAAKALAGKVVTIWVSTKLADGTWGAPKALTSRLIDINGNAYFWWKSGTATWVAVSASYAGDDNYAMSLSASPQARWIK